MEVRVTQRKMTFAFEEGQSHTETKELQQQQWTLPPILEVIFLYDMPIFHYLA